MKREAKEGKREGVCEQLILGILESLRSLSNIDDRSKSVLC